MTGDFSFSEQRGRRELTTMVSRIDPVAKEYFDAYMVIGVRAGSMEVGMHVTVAHSPDHELAVENMILMLAAEIVERRRSNAET